MHNICQINKDDYLDQDGILKAILAHERERRDRRRQKNDGIRNAEAIRLSLKPFVNMYLQKQPPEVFHKKVLLKKPTKFTGKRLCWSLFYKREHLRTAACVSNKTTP